MNIWGNRLRLSIFGESHGAGLGVVIDGLPSGFLIDFEHINNHMQRRAPGGNELTTPRREADEYKILSGLYRGRTTGTPLICVIENTNVKSEDYSSKTLRPSHADYVNHVKFSGFADYRGGGHSSARITAGLNFAGGLAIQLLQRHKIDIFAYIKQIGQFSSNVPPTLELLTAMADNKLLTTDAEAEQKMRQIIQDAKGKGDSVGGVVECVAFNPPVGLGEPFFESFESKLSQLIFSIPATKGIEFGSGFDFANHLGSETNDQIYTENGKIYTKTNHDGGINGGITNGMPIVFRVVFKPTPSIAIEQQSVDVEKMENVTLNTRGRHDPCVVLRALPLVESCLALCLYELQSSAIRI